MNKILAWLFEPSTIRGIIMILTATGVLNESNTQSLEHLAIGLGAVGAAGLIPDKFKPLNKGE